MITIAIPFYNAEKYLADAIRSVFAQTYQDWELLLVDDGSTDNSLTIAKSVRDSRVRVFSDGNNRKLATRLNQVAHEAKYPILARMDADDLMSPYRLEKQIKILNENKKINIVSTSVCMMTDNNIPVGHIGFKDESFNLNDLLTKTVIVHASIIGKKQWFLENPYDPTLPIGQDSILWIKSYLKKTLDSNNVAFIREPLYFYRSLESITVRKKLLVTKLLIDFLKKNLLSFETESNQLKKHLYKLIIKWWIFWLMQKTRTFSLFLKNKYSTQLPLEMFNLLQTEITQVLSTPVPGFDN
jgi:glycosyltransferase involved in cell wall biosynthesis